MHRFAKSVKLVHTTLQSAIHRPSIGRLPDTRTLIYLDANDFGERNCHIAFYSQRIFSSAQIPEWLIL